MLITSKIIKTSSFINFFQKNSNSLKKNFPYIKQNSQKNLYSLNYSNIRFSSGFRYTKDHEWISVEDSIGTVGITNFAQEALGDVVFVQLPEINNFFKKKETLGSVESVKTASDIYSPVSGTVIEVNTELENDPSLINKSPLKEGWMVKLKLQDKKELEDLMNQEEYDQYCRDEESTH
jgi:glycine cleavage system H protein